MTPRLAAFLYALVAAAAAAAETRREIDLLPAGTNGKLNRSRCDANTPFFAASWDFGDAVPVGTDLTVFLSKKSACDETDTANVVVTLRDEDDVSARQDAFPRTGDADLLPQSIAGTDCGGAAGSTGEVFLCVVYTPPTTTFVKVFGAEKIGWDTAAPAAPSGLDAEAGNRNVKLAWSAPASSDAVKSFIVRTKVAADGSVKREDTVGAPSTATTITGLENGTLYEFTVRAVDGFANEGPESEAVAAAPVPTSDFWMLYKEAGGSEGGGCAAGGGPGAAGLLALGLALALARRRRRSAAVAALLSAVALAPAAALAAPSGIESDQRFAIELKVGTYRPPIDDEFPNPASGPYAAVFGVQRKLFWNLEVDFQALRFFGTWGVGLSTGFFEDVGKARFGSLSDLGGVSTDTVLFRLVPIEALVVYRLDEVARRWNVPLVPYGKIGPAAVFWWSQDTAGQISLAADGSEARGLRWGYAGAAGLMLLLDFLDPQLAREFDADTGINNSYLFAEWASLCFPRFGGKGFLLSDAAFHFGLAMEL